jgi:hypothetical protein
MTSKVSGRWPAECGMPSAAKLTNVEITQARDLDVEFLTVPQRRADLHPRHGSQVGPALGLAKGRLAGISARDLVDPVAVHLLPAELQLEALAHHAGKKTAHRVRLPAGGLHHRFDRCARG